MTLRQVDQHIEAAAWRRRQSERMTIMTAWHVAMLSNHEKAGQLKDLEDYLPADDETGSGRGSSEAVDLPPELEEMAWHLLAMRHSGSVS